MSLVERLEKLAKELDQQRWRNGIYDADKADQSDLVAEAAKHLRALDGPPIMTCPKFTNEELNAALSGWLPKVATWPT